MELLEIKKILDENCIEKYNEIQKNKDIEVFEKITEISCFANQSEYNWN